MKRNNKNAINRSYLETFLCKLLSLDDKIIGWEVGHYLTIYNSVHLRNLRKYYLKAMSMP